MRLNSLISRLFGRVRTIGGSRFAEIASSLAATGAVIAFTAVGGVLLARYLGPEQRGELATVVLWPSVVAALGGLGMNESVTYFVAQDAQNFRAIVRTALSIVFVQSVALLALGAVVVSLVVSVQQIPATAAYLFLLSIPLTLFGVVGAGALNGRGMFRVFQFSRALPSVVTTPIIVILVSTERLSVATGAGAYLAGSAATALLVALSLLRADVGWPTLESTVARELLGYGLKSYVSGLPGQFNYRLDQMLISLFMHPVQLGLYGVAVTMMTLTSAVGASAQYVVLPAMARVRDGATRVRFAGRAIRWTVFGAFISSLAMFVVYPELIALLFGSEFAKAVEPGRILLAAAVALSARYALDGMLKGVGRPLAVGVSEVITLGVTIVTLPVLLAYYGIVGAAVATLIAYTVNACVMTWQLARVLEVSIPILVLGRS